jgi:transcriptional regulator with XRE-family HTH domain
MPVNFDKIRELRNALSLTQQDAADRAGFGEPNGKMRWNNIERGRYADLRLHTLEAVASALGVQVAELLVPIELNRPGPASHPPTRDRTVSRRRRPQR